MDAWACTGVQGEQASRVIPRASVWEMRGFVNVIRVRNVKIVERKCRSVV